MKERITTQELKAMGSAARALADSQDVEECVRVLAELIVSQCMRTGDNPAQIFYFIQQDMDSRLDCLMSEGEHDERYDSFNEIIEIAGMQ